MSANIIEVSRWRYAEVVRCADCEFCTFNESSLKHKCNRRGAYPEEVSPDDYCSKGRKIEE